MSLEDGNGVITVGIAGVVYGVHGAYPKMIEHDSDYDGKFSLDF